jgi:hypothetical protein
VQVDRSGRLRFSLAAVPANPQARVGRVKAAAVAAERE